MTFSIAARSADGTAWGVAVASKFLAVGSVVPAAAAGVGAVATQAHANVSFRPEGLRLLSSGVDAAETLRQLLAADPDRDRRQVGIVDRDGVAATYTGRECGDWAGGHSGDGYAVQGNILVGPQVIDEMNRAWAAAPAHTPLARRLLAALAAGDAAGGDRRGRQAAALLVVSAGGGYRGGNDVLVDLRVDDHATPVAELDRLLELHELHFDRPEPTTLRPLVGTLLDEVHDLLDRLGHRPSGPEPLAVHAALADWAAPENLEERMTPDPVIDPIVLTLLRRRAAG